MPARSPQDPEGALVERKHVERVVPVRQHHVGRIRETDSQVAILHHYPPRLGHVHDRELREAVCFPYDLLEQGELGVAANSCNQKIVEFCQYEGRQDERWRCFAQRRLSSLMKTLVGIDCGEQSAGVEDDHHSPKPASSSSTRSASVGSPLENRGNRGRGGSASLTRSLIASRMSSASLRPLSVARRPSADLRSSGK